MITILRKQLLLLAAALSLSPSLVNSKGCPVEPPACPEEYCECEKELCCPAPNVLDGDDFYIGVDFIWWVANESGLAFTSILPPTRAAGSLTKGPIVDPKMAPKPGFKIQAGYVFEHDFWDANLEYTWLRVNNSRKYVERSEMISLFNSDPQLSWYENIDYAEGSWDSRFNVLDATLGRASWNSKCLSLRPHVGLKASWQSQQYHLFYKLISVLDENDVLVNQKYWGVGLRSGVESAYFFFPCFSLYGDFAMSALWSKFNVREKLRTRLLSSNSNYLYNANTSSKFHVVVPVLELGLGLRFEAPVFRDMYHFMLQAGWELQEWWSMNNINNVYVDGARGDLTLQGLTIKARLDF
ncbi:MAG: hypothetical protein S4CHLAM102_05430 [Chlamydiia bacterium]|nr:hypothetical protein [Chlamydiia bacterium]